MASLIDLRRRIRTVKNTQQITKAMKMVAAAKLRRAQDQILATRPYALELRKVTEHLAAVAAGEVEHPLLTPHEGEGDDRAGSGKTLVLVVTGDKGLCGAFNAHVQRRTEQEMAALNGGGEILALGNRGADFFTHRGAPMRGARRGVFKDLSYATAQELAAEISKAYADGEYDAVYAVYNEFISVLSQRVSWERLLPIAREDVLGDESASANGHRDYLYEPSEAEILNELLPRFVTFQIYRVLLESQAAEHAARMTAMDSATKNAGELIDTLTLQYNRSRQAEITTELIEVVSGANALEG
ncbi:MAG: ATP synthase F1 subunit gamma [Acidobacteria bacterium]|nr:ATP synthase F1 subunit gamma [Acidobacteriota bacterium]MXZ37505.1 ATP synthase F1 subunit gamma [Holophagales bacterium]MYF05283.1 ATP synthase F1 subunit gamma [Holophagales bacterium]MYJ25531.1 ATP synthase F1 subunit gamma [Holophagales bacterium]